MNLEATHHGVFPLECIDFEDSVGYELVNERIGSLFGNVKRNFSPRILVAFTFLLFRNRHGMLPFSFMVTSHFLITLALLFSIFIGITTVGFQRHVLHFFSFLLRGGPISVSTLLSTP
jgi:F0F1-type ATP synthase membrane subunit a